MSEYRIEAVLPSVVEAVTQLGELSVNDLIFTFVDSRVLSAPANGTEVAHFQEAEGFRLVRAEYPYDHVSDLGNERGYLEVGNGASGSQSADSDPYETMTVAELKTLAESKGLELPPRAAKAGIIAALKAAKTPAQ